MGQYYQFVNRTRQEVSQISLPFNFRMPYAKSLERYDSQEVEAMFRFVIKHNAEWCADDELIAEGDYGEVITFQHSAEPSSSYGWESYTPDPVEPKPYPEAQ